MFISSSTSSTPTLSGASLLPRASIALNVEQIVNSLMQAKIAPLNKIDAEINKKNLATSATGEFQSRLAVFESNLANLEGTTFDSFDDLKDKLSEFVDSYNSLLIFYRVTVKDIASSNVDDKYNGALTGEISIVQFMEKIKTLLASGLFKYGDENAGAVLSLQTLGVRFQSDGFLLMGNPLPIVNLNLSQTKAELLDRFNANDSGVSFGFDSNSIKLRDHVSDSVLFANFVFDKAEQQRNLQSRRGNLQNRIETIRDNYFRQYAAIDAQLAKLQSLKTSLSAIFDSFNKRNDS